MNAHVSPYAGRWYPGDRAGLDRLLGRSFRESEERTGAWGYAGGMAYVVPHAGPQYSGTVAAAAYRSIARSRPERIVVIGFPHRGGLRGCAWPEVDSIATPLGCVPLDREYVRGLPFSPVSEDSVCDHSAEIQLPFLQHAAPGARIALLYAGRMDAEERRRAAAALAAAWDEGTVLTASSDFTHYGREFGFQPFPPDRKAADRIEDLDREAIEAAGSLDAGLFLEILDRSGATVCGQAPIALLLETLAARGAGAWQAQLDYRRSGELTGGYEHSVSYAALGYYPPQSFVLDETDRRALVESAMRALRHWRETGKRRAEPACGGSGALGAKRAVFVTVRHRGDLCGCMGNTGGRVPLAAAVPEMALSAALDDPRFPHPAETPDLEVEISVLTPFRLVRSAEQVEPGRHGVHLEFGDRRSLLLPQVAEERGWDREELLSALARKACLAPESWRMPGAKLSVFEAQVFS